MSRLVAGWDALWMSPLEAVRSWLLVRLVLATVALDCWIVMVPHGGRYGAGGFNVAHFAWIDQLMPMPSPALYVGLVLLCGILALLGAMGVLGSWFLALLAVLYTYGWAMSQLDSYQHHVFVTVALGCIACVPLLRAGQVITRVEGKAVACGAWGTRLLFGSSAIVYAYTGISKMEPAWRQGDVLVRIQQSGGKLQPFLDAAQLVGVEAKAFYLVAGHGVVVVQFLIAAAFVGVLVRGTRGGRWAAALRTVGLLAAWSFHLGAEYLELRIGWFTYYMVVISGCAFLPATWLQAAVMAFTWPVRWLQGRSGPTHEGAMGSRATLGAVALAAWSFVLVGDGLDVPGGTEVGWLGALLTCLVLIPPALGGRAREALAGSLGCLACAAVLATTMGSSSVRYDYHRWVGGDHARRGELTTALTAYGKANTYAPAGLSRMKKVVEIRGRLQRGEGRR